MTNPMLSTLRLVLAALLLHSVSMFSAFSGYAQALPPEKLISEEALATFTASTNIPVQAVAPAPMDGFVQLTTPAGILYLSVDGQYIVAGNVFNVPR